MSPSPLPHSCCAIKPTNGIHKTIEDCNTTSTASYRELRTQYTSMVLHVVHLRAPDCLGRLPTDDKYVLGTRNTCPGEDRPTVAAPRDPLGRRGQVILQRPNDEVLALRVGVEQTLRRHVLQDVLRAEELVADVFDQLREVLQPALEVALHPLDHRLVHFRLTGHAQVVAGYEFDDGEERQGAKLLASPDVGEVFLGISLGLGVKLGAGVEIGEGHEPETVAWTQPLLEEAAAVLAYLLELEEIGCGEELLNVLLADFDVSRVYEVDHLLHGGRVHLFQQDNVLATLR